MIGGYVYRERDVGLQSRLERRLGDSHPRIPVWGHGFLFHDRPFADGGTSRLITDDTIVLSQDLLVTTGARDDYRRLDLQADFARRLERDEAGAFDSIASDYRMAALRRQGRETTLFLVSNRAGSGRIYYHAASSGLVFCSDLRFLLSVVGCDVSHLGIYAILKYGAIPEPLTVSRTASAVPASHYLRYVVHSGEQRSLVYFRLRFPCERDEESGAREDDEMLRPVRETLQGSSRFLGERGPAILLSGGIDSSLYGCYLGEAAGAPLAGFYCAFGDDDPELEFARAAAQRIGSPLHVARMEKPDAIRVLQDVTRWTDHPFSDFSSLPIAFLLRFASERLGQPATIVECNGGDDCFGFPDLGGETKAVLKHRFPGGLKRLISAALARHGYWKWESHEGTLARLSALADVHESTPLDYFLVLAPVRYLGLRTARGWDEELWSVTEQGFSGCADDYDALSYRARATVRQLLHVNSRRWAAKALSVGESLGIRMVYPYIWREVLVEQGRLPWSAKVRDGVVKWPLKRLLEERMPKSFIYRKKSGFVPPFAHWLTHEDFNRGVRDVLLDGDSIVTEIVPANVLERLLTDAVEGRRLRHSVLNFLWGALFTEMWLREHGGAAAPHADS